MGSAAETTGGSEEPRKMDEAVAWLAGTRANPLAMEVSVNATGTRPGSGPDKRELFSEDTDTVLLFPDGAVIRLSAAVATGQLLFLTHKERNIEVVCQVIGKRIYRPTSCYVEVKFTEELPDFWGVPFPEASPEPQTPAAEAASIASAEVTEDGAETHAPVPTNEEVESLREDVEALRQKLQQAQKAKDAEVSMAMPAGPKPDVPEQEAANDRPEASHGSIALNVPVVEDRTEIMSANEPAPTFAPTFTPATVIAPIVAPDPPAPGKSFGLADDVAAARKRESATAVAFVPSQTNERKQQTPMALPNRDLAPKVDPEQELIDQLLPQPALDFSKAPKHVNRVDPDDPYSIYKPTKAKMEKWILVVLVLVLTAAVGLGVWKLGFLHQVARLWTKNVVPAAQTNAIPAPATAGNAAATGKGAPNEVAPDAGQNPAEGTAVADATTANSQTRQSAENEKKTANAADFHTAGPLPEAENNAVLENGTGKSTASGTANRGSRNVKKKALPAPSVEVPAETTPIPDDAPVIPAKLLKAVSPVYPPDAMNNFITGDVKLKAEVDEKGRIRDVEVLSGPAALRPAAIEAMKQYEYAPATKGGRGIASQINVTIKFWFNP